MVEKSTKNSDDRRCDNVIIGEEYQQNNDEEKINLKTRDLDDNMSHVSSKIYDSRR